MRTGMSGLVGLARNLVYIHWVKKKTFKNLHLSSQLSKNTLTFVASMKIQMVIKHSYFKTRLVHIVYSSSMHIPIILWESLFLTYFIHRLGWIFIYNFLKLYLFKNAVSIFWFPHPDFLCSSGCAPWGLFWYLREWRNVKVGGKGWDIYFKRRNLFGVCEGSILWNIFKSSLDLYMKLHCWEESYRFSG